MCRSGLHTSEVLHVYGEKKFTFSLSENIELPTSLDVFLSLFLPIACVLFVFGRSSPRRWTTFPQRGRNSPESHTSEKECFLSYS